MTNDLSLSLVSVFPNPNEDGEGAVATFQHAIRDQFTDCDVITLGQEEIAPGANFEIDLTTYLEDPFQGLAMLDKVRLMYFRNGGTDNYVWVYDMGDKLFGGTHGVRLGPGGLFVWVAPVGRESKQINADLVIVADNVAGRAPVYLDYMILGTRI